MSEVSCPPLWHGFSQSARNFADRPALEVGGRSVTYADMFATAQAWAATLDEHKLPADQPRRTAIYGNHEYTAYVGLLAAMLRGHAYVPLNPDFPLSRLRDMLEISECRTIIAGKAEAEKLRELLKTTSAEITVLTPEVGADDNVLNGLTNHRLITKGSLLEASAWQAPVCEPEDLAYVLFTSGTTGKPKAVGITHANVRALIRAMLGIYSINEHDRFSQFADLTFDASVHDMFYAWETGGCVCSPSFRHLVDRGRFIKSAKLTFFTSAPSYVAAMRSRGELKPGVFPDLRIAVFGGDGLPVDLARAWQAAAPDCKIYNCYGPTEVTVNCHWYLWDNDRSPGEAEQSFVPIGEPLPGLSACVVDGELKEVEPGATGELVMAGPQVAPGYLNNPEKTADAFIEVPGLDGLCYRTGDLVRRPLDSNTPYVLLGRIDNQVQIAGARVELGEVEAVFRDDCGLDAVVAVAWPSTDGVATGIELFIEASDLDTATMLERSASHLAPFARPKRIHLLDEMPLNINGKYDRRALIALLDDRAGS